MRYGSRRRDGGATGSPSRAAALAVGAAACRSRPRRGGAASLVRRSSQLQLDGVVDPFVADYLEGGIARAADDGAAAVLLDDRHARADSISSMRQITQAILELARSR